MSLCLHCLKCYDDDEHLPVSTACGHSLCRACAFNQNEWSCPFCGEGLPSKRQSLLTNYELLEVIEGVKNDEAAARECLLEGTDAERLHSDSPPRGVGGQAPLPPLVVPAEHVELTFKPLGSLGAGNVVLATYRGREVAAKILPLSGPRTAREDLLREALILARLSATSSHTARILGVTVKDSRLALLMRRHPANLTQYLEQQTEGRLPPGRVLLLAQDLLRGLAELHAAGVVVGGLKPENVLMREGEGPPVLADFGIGRALQTTVGQYQSTPAQSTPNYMAPEQFSAEDHAGPTPQTDMWALGATLLHALTGRPPWAGLSMGLIFRKVGNEHLSPELPPHLPLGPLRKLLQDCLQAEPQSRPTARHALARVTRQLGSMVEECPSIPHNAVVSIPLHIMTVNLASFGIAHQPAATIQVQADVGEAVVVSGGRRRRVRGRVLPEELHAAALPARLEHRRFMRKRQCFYEGLATYEDVTQGLLLEEGLVLEQDLAYAGLQNPEAAYDDIGALEAPRPDQLVLVNIKAPLPQVTVVFHGPAGVERVPNQRVAFIDTFRDLQDAALRRLPLDAAMRLARPFTARVDGRRRIVHALLGSGLVVPGGEVHLWARDPPDMQIFVKTLTGKMIPIRAAGSWLVEEVMDAVYELEGILPDSQRFIFAGNLLDISLTLSECNIAKESVLSLILRLPGSKP